MKRELAAKMEDHGQQRLVREHPACPAGSEWATACSRTARGIVSCDLK